MDSNDRAERRLVGACGIVFVVLSLAIGGLVPPPPEVGAGGAAVIEYFGAHQRAFLLGNFLGVAALPLGLVLLAYAVAVFRRAEPEGGWLWLLVLLAGIFDNAAGMIVLTVTQVAAYAAPHGGDAVARLVNDTAALSFALFFVAQLGYLAAFGWACLATRAWPPWLAWSAFALAALSGAASFGAVDTIGPLRAGGPATLAAFAGFFLWSLAFAIRILAKPSRPLPGSRE